MFRQYPFTSFLMTGALVAVLMVSMTPFVVAQPEMENPVQWVATVEEAFSRAKLTGKPVFVDVHAEWCGWCKKLERDVFPQPEVASLLNTQFIPVRVDTQEDMAFPQKYNVQGLPTLLILEANGRETGRIPGYMDAKPLVERLQDILKARAEIPRLKAAVAANPTDASAHYTLAMLAWDMDLYEDTVQHLEKVLEIDPKLATVDAELTLITLAQAQGTADNPQRGLEVIERFLKDYPRSTILNQARFVQGNLLYHIGRRDESRQAFQKVADAPPGQVPEELREHVLMILEQIAVEEPTPNN